MKLRASSVLRPKALRADDRQVPKSRRLRRGLSGSGWGPDRPVTIDPGRPSRPGPTWSARYPLELVRAPLPPQYDLRKLAPLPITGQQHEVAKTIFNRRAASAADLTVDDVAELELLSMVDQMQIFVALFYMFGTKVGAMKHRTGIE